MDMEDTLRKLRELEPLELAGQLVLAHTGQIPDFFALMEMGAAGGRECGAGASAAVRGHHPPPA